MTAAPTICGVADAAVSSPAPRTRTPPVKKTRPDDKVASLEATVPRGTCIVAESPGRHHESEGVQAVRFSDNAVDAAKAKVVSLEASIQALGDADPATLKVLQDALAQARIAANGAPVGVRLDSCAKYVERKKRLLAKCEEDMAKLQTLRASVEEELKAGEARLESIRAETAVPTPTESAQSEHGSRCVPHAASHRRVATGVESVASWRSQSHGRRARRWGGCRRQEEVAQVRSHNTSCHQRRCPVNTQLRFRCRRSRALYGLRGCRVGEARNPGPEMLLTVVDAVDMTVGDTDAESLATVEDTQSNESDGGGRDGASAFEGDHPDPVEELVEQVPDLQLLYRQACTRGLPSLDEVDLVSPHFPERRERHGP